MQKILVLIVAAAACLCFCARKTGEGSSLRVETDAFTGVIFHETAAAYVKGAGTDVKRWTPTIEEAVQADTIAGGCLKEDAPEVFENLKNYRRQFVGFYKNGRKCIFINFFSAAEGQFKDWESGLVLVKDGGRDFFDITIDLEARSCRDLYIHGEA